MFLNVNLEILVFSFDVLSEVIICKSPLKSTVVCRFLFFNTSDWDCCMSVRQAFSQNESAAKSNSHSQCSDMHLSDLHHCSLCPASYFHSSALLPSHHNIPPCLCPLLSLQSLDEDCTLEEEDEGLIEEEDEIDQFNDDTFGAGAIGECYVLYCY